MTSVCHFNLGHISFPGCLILICLLKRIQDYSVRTLHYTLWLAHNEEERIKWQKKNSSQSSTWSLKIYPFRGFLSVLVYSSRPWNSTCYSDILWYELYQTFRAHEEVLWLFYDNFHVSSKGREGFGISFLRRGGGSLLRICSEWESCMQCNPMVLM